MKFIDTHRTPGTLGGDDGPTRHHHTRSRTCC
jgi:hypothetical protein